MFKMCAVYRPVTLFNFSNKTLSYEVVEDEASQNTYTVRVARSSFFQNQWPVKAVVPLMFRFPVDQGKRVKDKLEFTAQVRVVSNITLGIVPKVDVIMVHYAFCRNGEELRPRLIRLQESAVASLILTPPGEPNTLLLNGDKVATYDIKLLLPVELLDIGLVE